MSNNQYYSHINIHDWVHVLQCRCAFSLGQVSNNTVYHSQNSSQILQKNTLSFELYRDHAYIAVRLECDAK